MTKRLNIKKILIALGIAVAVVLLIDIGRFFFYPDVAKLKKKNPGKTAFMVYREGIWKKEGKKKKIAQVWVPLSRISPHLRKAVIIAEDGLFWSHEGFDFDGIEEALAKNIKQGKLKSGGSTITQQLAKNLYLSPSKTPVRKLKEAILAWRLERELSKGRVLEIYLNVAQWGDTVFGIESASRYYFGKSSADLTAEEAVRLAVVLPNPVRWSPIGKSKYIDNRARTIYNIMVKRGMVPVDFSETEKATGSEDVSSAIDPVPSSDAVPTTTDALPQAPPEEVLPVEPQTTALPETSKLSPAQESAPPAPPLEK